MTTKVFDWQRFPDKGKFTYAEALLYAAELDNEYTDKIKWRLPTIYELVTALEEDLSKHDYTESAALGSFKEIFMTDWFWSSTSSIYGNSNEMMAMNFRTGRSLSNSVYNRVRVCCVRDR